MTPHEQPPLKTPPQRRLVATDVPGVYRRGKRYVAVTQARGKKIKSSHDTKDQARRAKFERKNRARPSSREPFDEYAERWLVEYRGRTAAGLSPQTRGDYAQVMRTWVIPYFGRTRLDAIGSLDVKHFIDHLCAARPLRTTSASDRLAASSIRRIMTPLKALLAEAHELELFIHDPGRVRIVVPSREPRQAPKVLDRKQVDELMRCLPEKHRLLFELLRWTGLRISEALGLQWRDLVETSAGPVLQVRRQSRGGRVLDKPKTAASVRDVAVVPALAAALRERRATRSDDPAEAPVFASRGGAHLDAHNIRRVLRPAAVAAGVPWATPRTFRHSLATEMLLGGYDVSIVARVLGHRSEAFTRRIYVHVPLAPRFDALEL